jgi:pimeloyl-ACP methyl ester carboxylesterase
MKLEVLERTPEGQARPTPLLFVHGMWHGAWCWDGFFLPFFAANGYRAVAVSLRGHAGSEGRAGLRWYSIADYVKDVEQVASGLGAPPIIIGHSMGGFVTQKYLETHTAPAGVLLASVPSYGLWPATARIFLHDPLTVLAAIFTLSLYPIVRTPQKARWALFSANMPEEQLIKYQAKMHNESFRAYLDLLGLNLARPKRVKTPLLILGAEKDMAIAPGDVKATARAYGTQADLFPSMAHDMMLEAGWKSVVERILSWLGEMEKQA